MPRRVAPPDPPRPLVQRLLPWADLLAKVLAAAAAAAALWRGLM